jgi:hypothetical protein
MGSGIGRCTRHLNLEARLRPHQVINCAPRYGALPGRRYYHVTVLPDRMRFDYFIEMLENILYKGI